MSDDTSSGELLIANLCAFDPADRGEAIVDLAAFEWFSPVYGGFDHRLASESPADVAMRWRAILSGWGHTSGVQVWPPPLSAVELEHARSCPTLPEPTPNLQAEPASKSHSPVAATVVSVGAVVVALLYALAGIVFLPVGLYLGWRSLGTGFDWKGAATGLFLIVIGAFCVASAYRCCRFAGNARDRLGRREWSGFADSTMDLLRRLLRRAGIGAAATPSLRARAAQNLVADAAPDRPRGFGYKINWFAVNATAAEPVLDTLHLSEARSANWASGLAFAHAPADQSEAGDFVFVSPPVEGWVFIVGTRLPYPDHSATPERHEINLRFDRIFTSLASHFPDVQFFGSHRVVGFCAWARARAGRVERVFSYADGEVYANVGEQSVEEKRLGFVDLAGLSPAEATEALFAHAERQDAKREELVRAGWDRSAANKLLGEQERSALPDEGDPLAVAAAWSLDPSGIFERDLPVGSGTVARLRNTVPRSSHP